jgi:dTDP-4-dehydrorhamnose 3,5-epimerase
MEDLKIFRATPRRDSRGYVLPTYSKQGLRELGITFDVVHENHCWSPTAGTIRGFHYQLPPYAQPKLIRVVRGAILDVNVDLRKGSPTFGRHAKAELNPDGWSQILVPAGFAHCYCTLTDDVEVVFKLGCEYAPQYARGLRWNDSDLGIQWPVSQEDAIVLERDLNRPGFRELTDFFPYPSS